MHRAVAALVILVITGAQPAYACVLICLLDGHAGHGHMEMVAIQTPGQAGPGHGQGMHHHPSNTDDGPGGPTQAPCHTNNFTAGSVASIAPISATVGAVGITLPEVVAVRSRPEQPEHVRLPELPPPSIESPPPRV